MPDGPEQEARDALFLSQLGKELKGPFPSRWTCPEIQPWLYGYDAYEEVERALKADTGSKPSRSDEPGDGSGAGWFSGYFKWLFG